MTIKNFIRVDEVQKQLARIPFKYPFMEAFIKNRDLHDEIVRIASERAGKNLEDIIVSCGDLFFSLLGKRYEKTIDFFT